MVVKLLCRGVRCFNSRSRVGSDVLPLPGSPIISSFNSRSRVGSDGVKHGKPRPIARFNSRSRVGSDPATGMGGEQRHGFNSRSRVGSDFRGRRGSHRRTGFNSRSRVGSDRAVAVLVVVVVEVSIRAPAWGATVFLPRWSYSPLCFNSRSRVGSDCHQRMAGTVWLEQAVRASLPKKYRTTVGILHAMQKIIILFIGLSPSLTPPYFAANQRLALNNQCIVEYIRRCFCTVMLNFIASFTAEHIKTQAICFWLIGL